MITLPDSGDKSLVIRTDFSENSKWRLICDAIKNPANEFESYVEFIDEIKFNHLEISQLPKFPSDQEVQTFVLLVDEETSLHPEYPIKCVDLVDEFGRSFRVIPSQIWGVTANLSIANMDFYEFADNVNADGIFRGF